MNAELLTLLDRLSPSNQRLIRELMFKLAQLEQITTPEQHDAALDYTAQMDPWLVSLVNRGMSHHTVKHYGAYVHRLLANYPHPTRTHIDAFLAEATVRGNKPTTIADIINGIKSFFGYLQDSEVITTNAASRLQRPHIPRSLRKAPTVLQVALLLEASTSPRHRLMLQLLVDCGLRRHELVTIRISDVDAENRLIRVTGKGRKERQVPVSPAIASIMSRHIDELRSTGYEGDWLFPGQDPEGHISSDSVHSYLERLCRKAGIPRISPHQLRHYFATQMLSSGANLKVTSEILGHKDTSTTADIYWHIMAQKEVMDQHDKYSPLSSGARKLSTF